MFKSACEMVDRHYKAMVMADCNTCNVGTWAIKRSAFLCKSNRESRLWGVLRAMGFGGSDTPCANPVPTIAERAEKKTCHTGAEKMLVLSKGPTFSEAIMTDALRMAAKTGMAIVALNMYEQGNEFPEFQRQAKSSIDGFQRKARAVGLNFTHMVVKGPEVLTMTRLLASGFRFRHMMMDTTRTAAVRTTAPVYTRATLRAD
jgi:hypothetical protein